MGGKEKNEKEVWRKIRNLLGVAERNSKEHPEAGRKVMKKARRLAMHFNIKLPLDIRKRFCRNCYSLFTGKNCKRRIKNGYLILTCLNCNKIHRYKID